MKTKNEILNQIYITANDLKVLIPTMGINACRDFIKKVANEAREEGLYVPSGKIAVAPTNRIKKVLGI